MPHLGKIAGLISLFALAFVRPAFADDDTSTLVGKPAPSFELTCVDGQTVKLADEKGKVVVVDFWATWCGPCRASLPHVQHLSADKDLAAKGLVVWAVNDREDKDTIVQFKKDNNYTFTAPMDSSGGTLQSYLVQGIPTTVIVGTDGVIKNVFIGFDDSVGAKIDEAVKSALADHAQ